MKKNKNSKPKNKIEPKNIVILAILLVSIVGIAIFGVAFSPLDTSTLYITGNDVIQNYELESFDGNEIVDGMVQDLDNKIIFEPSGSWIATEEDLEIIGDPIVIGDQVTIQYFLTLRHKTNIYTNVKLNQAVEKDLRETKEDIFIGYYRHIAWDGNTRFYWERSLQWTHYDFGNVKDYNFENNLFSGALKGSFDINPNPTPLNFTDDDGNLVETQFDYISINSMYLSDIKHGKLSEILPTIETTTPEDSEQEETNDKVDPVPGDMSTNNEDENLYYLWDPHPDLSDAKYTSVDPGLNPGTIGSTLFPKNKDGSPIWDPAQNQKSMEDCSFTYNLPSLSPLVYEYTSTLSWKNQICVIQDDNIAASSFTIKFEAEDYRTETRQVALHVTNRYVQTEFLVKFKLFTGFKITIPKTDEPELDLPKEYYYDLLWQAIVDGFGGGNVYAEPASYSDIMDLITIIIIIVIVIAGIYIFIQVGMPLILRKRATDVIRKR